MKERGDRRDGGRFGGGVANDNELADYARERTLRRRLEALVKAELQGADMRWIEQAFSPLGPRRHIAAVRRRLADAEARGVTPADVGAAVLGRRYLLTPESLAEELGRLPVRKVREPAANDVEESAYAAYMARPSSRE